VHALLLEGVKCETCGATQGYGEGGVRKKRKKGRKGKTLVFCHGSWQVYDAMRRARHLGVVADADHRWTRSPSRATIGNR
jgi:hypothetical protein